MKRTASVFKLLLAAIIFLQTFACKKGLVETQADSLFNESKNRSLATLTTRDIYVAGSEGGQAKYWKNGVGVTLPGGSDCYGITVVGTDVYACGTGGDPVTGKTSAVYWKNGVPTYLPYDNSFTAFASGIAVWAGDVYVTGRIDMFSNIGVYWKNGVAINLGNGEANSISIDNGDIYIANSDASNPSYWKNGVLVPLPALSNTSVVRVVASGGNVYATGSSGLRTKKGVLWRNGVRSELLSPTMSYGYAVAVDGFGNPVVVGTQGTSNQNICYWANDFGSPNILGFGQQITGRMGVTVDTQTGEIFACGSEYPGQAMYWIISPTGSITPVPLNPTTNNAFAYAIALGQ
ncbi:hypothetical protein FAM09_28650 [Niastella caeni]|uniref:Bulb-type lectin domain-containing protein n=1 Tax=Niastella caeni TaxID=2569763 RepID=A0A4V4GZ74_9BACT|nr:hypothetical protein [Niastella caeni]THU31596.1 hypothetical protein FAM09_28650 [Niastella caeni]